MSQKGEIANRHLAFFFHAAPAPFPRVTMVRDSTDGSLLDACVPVYDNPTWPADEGAGTDVLVAVLCLKLQVAEVDVEMVCMLTDSAVCRCFYQSVSLPKDPHIKGLQLGV